MTHLQKPVEVEVTAGRAEKRTLRNHLRTMNGPILRRRKRRRAVQARVLLRQRRAARLGEVEMIGRLLAAVVKRRKGRKGDKI